MSTNSIFVLKPILDLLYEEAKKDHAKIAYLEGALKERLDLWNYKQDLETLKSRVQVLEQYNRELVEENRTLKAATKSVVIDDIIDDNAYATEANAPAHTYVEEKLANEIVVPIIVQKEDAAAVAAAEAEPKEESTKIVKMVGEKTKKEYQREYQRAYRKKQKEITTNQ